MKRIYQGSVIVASLCFGCAIASGLPGFGQITGLPGESFSMACHLLLIGGISLALLVRASQSSFQPLEGPAKNRHEGTP